VSGAIFGVFPLAAGASGQAAETPRDVVHQVTDRQRRSLECGGLVPPWYAAPWGGDIFCDMVG